MIATAKPIRGLAAQDLMSKSVEVIPQEMSLASAARILSSAHISGAPVVDNDGRCVGVLSTTDFVRWASRDKKGHGRIASCPECVCSDGQIIEMELLPTDEVRWYMTADPVTVLPSTTVREIASKMLDAHIHRVLVVDTMKRPVGIITSTDLLAALARPSSSAM